MKSFLSNSVLKLSVNHQGAELSSLMDFGGIEYLWQGDAAIWPRQSPHLFPIVGRLRDDRYTLNGRSYQLSHHGFARDMDFELISEVETELRFQLVATAESRLKYPFDFALIVSYRLQENCLTVEYDVHNRNDTILPFSLGAHPGFALSWGKENVIEDYFLEFDRD